MTTAARFFVMFSVLCGICCSASLLRADGHVYAYPVPLTAADELRDGPEGHPIKCKPGTTFIWVDLMPEADFAHPTLYVLLNGREAKMIQGEWWPVLNGDTVLYGAASPLLIKSELKQAAGKEAAPAAGRGGKERQVVAVQGKTPVKTKPCEEPQSNVIRPRKVDAKVKGCTISEPGRYRATPGDLVEIEYTFPVVPGAMPDEVRRETDKGATYISELGIRHLIVPELVGTGTYVFYFEAKHKGKGTAFVVIDKVKYEYVFEVEEPKSK